MHFESSRNPPRFSCCFLLVRSITLPSRTSGTPSSGLQRVSTAFVSIKTASERIPVMATHFHNQENLCSTEPTRIAASGRFEAQATNLQLRRLNALFAHDFQRTAHSDSRQGVPKHAPPRTLSAVCRHLQHDPDPRTHPREICPSFWEATQQPASELPGRPAALSLGDPCFHRSRPLG